MKNRIRKITALLLAAGITLTGVAYVPEQVQAKDATWYSGLNPVIPSVRESADGYVTSPNSVDVPVVTENSSGNLKKASSVPSAYMNRLEDVKNLYPDVRNQGKYNTCWAFSAIGLAEFDLITDNKTADRNIDLSELQLAYFTYHNAEDGFGGTLGDSLAVTQTGGNYLNLGGNLDYCSRTLLQWEGVTQESVAPYATASASAALSKSDAFDKDVAHLQNVYIINIHKNPDLVKKEIMNHGAAGIGLFMDDNLAYAGTSIYETTGELVATYYCPYKNKSTVANHAVNIVGWDDSFPASAFNNNPKTNGAWLCRNSWSDQTGNEITSYFWLSYADAALEDAAWIFDFESADNYDFNYQYDGGGVVYKTLNFSTAANVFKVQGADNELLRAVSLTMTKDANVPYTISVYTNLTSPSKPRSGVLAAKVSGTTTYAGTNTIPLNKAVSVPKGTYYSVVVKLGKKNAGVDTEMAYNFGDLKSKVYCDYHQSLVYYNGKWEDLADLGERYGIGNLCIKAFSDKTGAKIEKVKGMKASVSSKNAVRLSWDKISGAEGYEIYVASSKNGTYKKAATTTGSSYKITSSSKKTRYYKVRAYKTNNGNRVNGAFSSRIVVKH